MGNPRFRRERLCRIFRTLILNASVHAFLHTYDFMTALHIWILDIYPQAKGVWTESCEISRVL